MSLKNNYGMDESKNYASPEDYIGTAILCGMDIMRENELFEEEDKVTTNTLQPINGVQVCFKGKWYTVTVEENK